MRSDETQTDPLHPEVDPVLTEVICNRIGGVAAEMGTTLVRASFSPNIKQRADCSTAVLGPDGQVLAQAPRIPIHLGSLIGSVRHLLAHHPLERLQAGDMFLANDPYSGGGQHLPDISFLAPVFVDGAAVGFVANIAHHADVGGMLPGSEASVCRTIFQEGLRLPPVRIVRGGEIEPDIVAIIALNSRTPAERRGDILAQISANRIGVQRLEACYRRYGRQVVETAVRQYLDATERRIRRVVEGIEDGVFHAADLLDPDLYLPEHNTPIALRLEKQGNALTFDFAGTGPQLPSSRNVPLSALLSTVYCVVKTMLDPGLAANSGYFRAITVRAPEGSVLNPAPGAAVGTRALTCAVVGDVVAAAISQMLPARALAGCGPHHQVIFSGRGADGSTWVDYETFAGAQGARPYQDGLDAVRVHASGASNLPVEALEQSYPLRVERYALREGSAGAGTFRGGLGVVRDYRALDEMTVSLSAERQTVAPRGADGGGDGARGAFILEPGTPQEQRLPSAVGERRLAAGEVLRILTPGGAGFGDPAARAPERVRRDRLEGRDGG